MPRAARPRCSIISANTDRTRGEMLGRKNGSMIAKATEKSVAYALDTLQQRGRLFVKPGDECYEGMIVGESAKEGDMVVNVAPSTKQPGQPALLHRGQGHPADAARSPSRLKRRSSTSRTTSWWRSRRSPFACASASSAPSSVRRLRRNKTVTAYAARSSESDCRTAKRTHEKDGPSGPSFFVRLRQMM